MDKLQMAESDSDDELMDIDFLVADFDEWKKNNSPEELLSVSAILSDILPKLEDDSLFDIDDILYPDQKWSDYETSRHLIHTNKLFERTDMSRYVTAYFFEVRKLHSKDNVLYDYTLLKVVQHLPEYYGYLRTILRMSLDFSNERRVCFGLKLLKTLFKGKHNKSVQFEELCSLVSTYRDIPTKAFKDSNKEQIALFISKLANECYEKFHKKFKNPDENLKPERKIKSSIHYILYYFDYEMPIYQRNILYTVFTSAEGEETKRKYLKWLVEAIDTSCLKTMFEGFKVLANCLLWTTINSKSRWEDDKMRLIDMECGRNIEPYLPGFDVPIELEKLWNDENNEDETDYTFEKLFFYDEVMKNLHLLKIFYAAAAERQEFDDKDYTEAFRDNEFILKNIGYYLINKDKNVPWYLEKTLEMCPFIIFPRKHKQLVFDLIRVLRRETEVPQNEKLSRKIKQMEDCYNTSLKPRGPKQFRKPPF